MTNNAMSAPTQERDAKFENVTSQLNHTERFAVSQAYPPKLILFTLGTMWSLHFIWERLWAQAIIGFSMFALMGMLSARGCNKEFLYSTTLGKVFVEMAQPFSVLMQALGFAAVLFGAYVRGPFYVLIGASLVLLIHAAAWKRILSSPHKTGRGI